MEGRLNNQINWYDTKSNESQKYYKRFQKIEIIAAAVIPLLSGYVSKYEVIPIIVSVLGTVVVVCASISRLGKYHEKWLQYRATCELLKHEKYLFLTSTNPYNGDEPFRLLVERVESIISAENINWSQLATSEDKK
ncbi:DUF4231 domain-containing protein [Paenibacillus naphthalenovorans]|uniref:DUF4231 domain-containing protein n=1 Tax=Paenibacillus naphthalenovorans TaxID=162209 RepID=UPI0026756D0D|nr:DUF4231 domain-containing protein [Paenibacillus naphthalenovorans]